MSKQSSLQRAPIGPFGKPTADDKVFSKRDFPKASETGSYTRGKETTLRTHRTGKGREGRFVRTTEIGENMSFKESIDALRADLKEMWDDPTGYGGSRRPTAASKTVDQKRSEIASAKEVARRKKGYRARGHIADRKIRRWDQESGTGREKLTTSLERLRADLEEARKGTKVLRGTTRRDRLGHSRKGGLGGRKKRNPDPGPYYKAFPTDEPGSRQPKKVRGSKEVKAPLERTALEWQRRDRLAHKAAEKAKAQMDSFEYELAQTLQEMSTEG